MTWTLISLLGGAIAALVQELRRRSAVQERRDAEANAARLETELKASRSTVTRLEGVVASRDRLLDEALHACTDSASADPRAALVRVRLALDPTGAGRARLQARGAAPDP